MTLVNGKSASTVASHPPVLRGLLNEPEACSLLNSLAPDRTFHNAANKTERKISATKTSPFLLCDKRATGGEVEGTPRHSLQRRVRSAESGTASSGAVTGKPQALS